MAAIYKDGQWYGGDDTGHLIKDAGTDFYPREALNFIDHDLQDDSVNDETKIKTHRLTSAELSEIINPQDFIKPGLNNKVIFDERDIEYVVGEYIHSDGTKQPVYQKTFTGNTVPSTRTVLMNNVDQVINAFGSQVYSRTGEPFQFPYVYAGSQSLVVRWLLSTANTLDLYRGGTDTTPLTNYKWTFQYTKTTDTPV